MLLQAWSLLLAFFGVSTLLAALVAWARRRRLVAVGAGAVGAAALTMVGVAIPRLVAAELVLDAFHGSTVGTPESRRKQLAERWHAWPDDREAMTVDEWRRLSRLWGVCNGIDPQPDCRQPPKLHAAQGLVPEFLDDIVTGKCLKLPYDCEKEAHARTARDLLVGHP